MATSPVPVSPALSHGSPGFGPGGLTEGRRARRAQDAGRLILGPGGGGALSSLPSSPAWLPGTWLLEPQTCPLQRSRIPDIWRGNLRGETEAL